MSSHGKAPGRLSGAISTLLGWRSATVVVALLALAVASPILAPGSLGASALLSMLPFAAVLAVVAAGQTLIVRQAGIDLSVAGAVSLSAMLLNTVAAGEDSRVGPAIAIAIGSTVVAGAVTGFVVSWFRVTPLVATLAVNGLLLGAVLAISGGQSPEQAPAAITAPALARTVGIPNLVIAAFVLLAALTFLTTRTVYGRRFLAVGVSPRAARVAGIRTTRYTVSAFALAGLCYGAGGTMLAAYTGSPSVFSGTSYLLPSIAAVVIGGAALSGGRGSIVATALGALFLTQLDQVVSGLGGPNAVQNIVQGAVILVALTLHGAITAIRTRIRRRSRDDSRADPTPIPSPANGDATTIERPAR